MINDLLTDFDIDRCQSVKLSLNLSKSILDMILKSTQ